MLCGAWTGVLAAETSAALLTPSDALVAVPRTGATREALEPLPPAADRGYHGVALTGDPRSPIAQAADLTLTSFSGGAGIRHGGFGTRHSVLPIVDCPYAGIAQLTCERATVSVALTAHIADGRTTRPRRR